MSFSWADLNQRFQVDFYSHSAPELKKFNRGRLSGSIQEIFINCEASFLRGNSRVEGGVWREGFKAKMMCEVKVSSA